MKTEMMLIQCGICPQNTYSTHLNTILIMNEMSGVSDVSFMICSLVIHHYFIESIIMQSLQ